MCLVNVTYSSDADKTDFESIAYNWIFKEKRNQSFSVNEVVDYLTNKGFTVEQIDVKKTLHHWSDTGLVYSSMDGYHVLNKTYL